MGSVKYDDDDDERQRLLQTIPPGNVTARGVHGSESGILEAPEVYKSRWRSIRVMYLTMFLSSVSFSICMSSIYPYLKVLDPEATTNFLGWVVAAYSVGQLIASPFFGAWSNWRKRAREPIIVSLTINVLANVLYMYLESLNSERAAMLIVARAFVGFGAGNVAVVRSYASGATTLKERTPAMANMSACQAVGFIIGPVIQTAMVPIGFPGPIHSPGLHLDMYTATALLGAVVGVMNIILLVVVFKEHRVPSVNLIPDIQGSAAKGAGKKQAAKGAGKKQVNDIVEETKDTPLDYLAVTSSIALFFSVLFIFSVFETISTPLSMHMFAWTKSKATLLIGVMLGCAGVVSIAVFVAVKMLSKRFNERYLLFGGFVLCLCGFIVFLPWGSHYPDIQYADYTTLKISTKISSTVTSYTDLTSEFPPSLLPLDNLSNSSDMYNSYQRNFTEKPNLNYTSGFNHLSHNIDNRELTNSQRAAQTTDYVKQTTSFETISTNTITSEILSASKSITLQPASEITYTTHTHVQTTKTSLETTETSPETTTAYTTKEKTVTTNKIPETTSTSEHTTQPPRTSTVVSSSKHTTVEEITTDFTPTTSTTESPVENTTQEAVGCPYYYNWCFNTPAILLWQFLLGTFFVAVGYPVCNVMSYAIYSKILGPKPQGVWMGWLTAAGSLARCLGPVFVSQVYDAYGPRVTFISMCVLTILTIVGFLIVFRRLVPYRKVTTVSF